jgi:hypothetical protein
MRANDMATNSISNAQGQIEARRIRCVVSIMGRGPCAWKETDVRRAVKAVAATGQPVKGVRFDKDGFTVLTGEPECLTENGGATDSRNDWDEIIDGKV